MITYKYSSKLKFLLIVLLGTIKSSEYVILAYIVGTLTNIATNHQLGRLPGFIAFVICTFVLLTVSDFMTELNRSHVKTNRKSAILKKR